MISEGFPVTVFQESVRVQQANQWHARKVNLAAWSGKNVTLRLETLPTRPNSPIPWADRVRTAWGDPKIEARTPTSSTRRASMILIVVDTLRYDYLGVNGFHGDVSPNLDWLAMESVRFDNAFAAAPWIKPSTASILTGLHPTTHGVLDHNRTILPGVATDALSDEAVTLAEAFREQGYTTAGFVANPWIAEEYGYGQGFDRFVSIADGDDLLIREARDWLLSLDDSRPYLLYLHLLDVHAPYRSPERDYWDMQESQARVSATTARSPTRTPWCPAICFPHPGPTHARVNACVPGKPSTRPESDISIAASGHFSPSCGTRPPGPRLGRAHVRPR